MRGRGSRERLLLLPPSACLHDSDRKMEGVSLRHGENRNIFNNLPLVIVVVVICR